MGALQSIASLIISVFVAFGNVGWLGSCDVWKYQDAKHLELEPFAFTRV